MICRRKTNISRKRHNLFGTFALLAIVVAAFVVHRVNPITALTTTPSLTTREIPFQDFRFAPNNVCVHPEYFVARGEDGDEPKYFTMRNVPGDGDCMFLAVALAAATSMGLGGSNKLLSSISRETRDIVAQVLSSSTGKLFIGPQQNNTVDASRLLQSAVMQETTISTPEEYLAALRKEGREGGLYGGGPELVVLSNVLRRPISIYEVDENFTKEQQQENLEEIPVNDNGGSSSGISFPIVCKGSFGEGVFEDPCLTSIPDSVILANMQPGAYSWRLHILVLNASPTEKHACVLLPQQIYK